MGASTEYNLQGLGGSVILNADTSTATVNGPFRGVLVINDAMFTAYGGANITNSSNLSGVMVPAGIFLGGITDSVAISTGVVVAYKL